MEWRGSLVPFAKATVPAGSPKAAANTASMKAHRSLPRERKTAIDDTCTHDEASLAEAVMNEGGKCIVECPWHGAFRSASGAALTLPAVTAVNAYRSERTGGGVDV
jgi:nitrite reductase/ring-hydroxylating ferredoxin subunit